MAMEQIGKYWGLWASTRSSSEPSWEEQAFARDAAAHLVWPPRSYSCSFCQREFRSAQALGGHMNVHRRDRALLRQGSSPDDDGQGAFREQPKQGPFFCRTACSNPSTTTTTTAAAAAAAGTSNTAFFTAKGDVNRGTAPPPSYLASSIIKESKNKLFMSMIPASITMKEEVMHRSNNHHDDDVESGRMKRRRLLDPPSVAVVSMVTSSESQGLQGIFDPNAKVKPTKTTKTIISSSIPPLGDQQGVDLELRLGTTPKVT